MIPFQLDLYTQWMVGVLLMTFRIGPTLLSTPLFSETSVPLMVRVAVVIGLSAALLACFGPDAAGHASSTWTTTARNLVARPGTFFQSACTELALGATLALAVQTAFSTFALAGRLLDIQIGFGLAEVFDPASNASLPILATAFNQLAMLVFFLVNGHHALLRGLAFSLQQLPLGQPWSMQDSASAIIQQFTGLFAASFSLVAPVVICLLMTEFSLGVVSRNLPQINMLSMGVPVKIVVGLIALALWFSSIGSLMDNIYKGIYTAWNIMLSSQPEIGRAAQ